MNFNKMKKAELVELVVPAKIKRWQKNTPEYSHEGKETQLRRLYWSKTKKTIIKELEILYELGFVVV